METDFIAFPLSPDGLAAVVVEVAATGGGPRRVSRVGDGLLRAQKSLGEALETVRPTLATLSRSLHDINNPAEIEVEFGIKLSADFGAVITTAGSEVNFKIILKWKNPIDAGGKNAEGA